MNENLQELGLELVENARLSAEFSAQRGLINELFPYVYEASKRMSSRAISRWLESKGMKLSAATIAKALRNPEPYWQELADEIEPPATIFSNAYDICIKDVLLNKAVFIHLSGQPPSVEGTTRDGVMDSFDEIQRATTELHRWYDLPETAREACLAYADLHLEKVDAPENKPAIEEGKK